MSNFRFDNRSDNNRDGGRAPLYDAICDECGKDCKVPFRPSGDKPVYCSECFESKGGGGRGDNRSGQRGSFRRSGFGGRDSGGSGRGSVSSPDFSKLTRNIEVLNGKLDSIISLLSSDEKQKVKPFVKKEEKIKVKTKVNIEGKPKKVRKSSVKSK